MIDHLFGRPRRDTNALTGAAIAIGRALHTSDDGDGRPVYTIDATDINDVASKVHVENVEPFRFYDGVKVDSFRGLNGLSPCFGVRDPELGWIWVVTERIRWKVCP